MAKQTSDTLRIINALSAEGWTYAEIADAAGISTRALLYIRSGEREASKQTWMLLKHAAHRSRVPAPVVIQRYESGVPYVPCGLT